MTIANSLRTLALRFALRPGPEQWLWLMDDARINGSSVPGHAGELLFMRALDLRREHWNGEELCAMILWLSRYIEEAVALQSHTTENYPLHVIRGMLTKAASLVQNAYAQRTNREQRRPYDPYALRAELPLDAQLERVIIAGLAKALNEARRASVVIPNTTPEQLPALLLMAQRWLERSAQELTERSAPG